MQGAQLPGGRRARIQSTETHSLVVAVEIIPAVKIIIVVYFGGMQKAAVDLTVKIILVVILAVDLRAMVDILQ